MDKAISILVGILLFLAYISMLFLLGFATSPVPKEYRENITNAYVISCIVNAGMTVALLVERGVLGW